MKERFNWDAWGIAASLACAVHCAILPLLVSSLPIFGVNLVENVAFEYFMIVLAAAIGTYSLWHGYRNHHRRILPFLLFGLGIIFLVAKQIWHHYQFWLLPFAVSLIVMAHLDNYKYCRISPHRHAGDSDS